MKLNTHQDGLEVAPLLDDHCLTVAIPAIASWDSCANVMDVQIDELHVQPSSDGECAYLVVQTTVHFVDADSEQVWACSCQDFRYRKGADTPGASEECKHIRMSGSKAKKAQADDEQGTLGQ